MRALVISDTHFGAWTGEDLLCHEHELALLAPHLDDVDEVIFLGDLFDFLFSSVADAVVAAAGLLDLLREKLQGKRLVFLAGNHDHHLVTRAAADLLERELTSGQAPASLGDELAETAWFRHFLERRLSGVRIELRYPTYTFGGVLCTHGHYLDYHAHRHGSLPNRLLGRALWSIAAGGERTSRPSMEDYESVITLLTELLYTVAQLPHGTAAQRNVYGALQRAETITRMAASPLRAGHRARAWLADRGHVGDGPNDAITAERELTAAEYRRARADARDERAGVEEARLHGHGQRLWFPASIFALGGLAVAGLPPFGPFLGHALVEDAASQAGYGWLPAAMLVISALTGAAVLRTGARIFLELGPAPKPDESGREADEESEVETDETHATTPALLVLPAAVLLAAGLAWGVIPGLTHSLIAAAAHFTDHSGYQRAVLSAIRETPMVPSTRRPSAESYLYGVGATLAALAVAALALYVERLPKPAARALAGLRALQSGRIGDYVGWLSVGVATIGGALTLTLR